MALTDEDKNWITTSFTAQIKAEIGSLREYIDERTHDAETRLLRAFADYNNSNNVRMRKLEADMSNVDTSTTLRLGGWSVA